MCSNSWRCDSTETIVSVDGVAQSRGLPGPEDPVQLSWRAKYIPRYFHYYSWLQPKYEDRRVWSNHSEYNRKFKYAVSCFMSFTFTVSFPMRYCTTWSSLLLCCVKKFITEEFVIRVFLCTSFITTIISVIFLCWRRPLVGNVPSCD